MSAFFLKDPDCVLIHIPKTAGSSIRKGVWNGRYEGPHFGRLPRKWKRLFSFGFVRNPYSRLLSVWRMFSMGANDSTHSEPWVPLESLSINDILYIVEDDTISYGPTRNNYEEHLKHHALPMSHPFNALKDAKFIGRFETLNQDWEKICSLIGMETTPLPSIYSTSKNKGSQSGPYDFDSSTLDRIRKIYKSDFKKYGYSI